MRQNLHLKIHDMGINKGGEHYYVFHCPGCHYGHYFIVPRWTWNGSYDRPTVTPSLLMNSQDPSALCHATVTDGKITFHEDSFHSLVGQTVDLPDWN